MYDLYSLFLPLFFNHRDYFYDYCEIGSIYGSPMDCLWGGGRVEMGLTSPEDVIALMSEYGVSSRLTFSNLLLREKHLSDKRCNNLCEMFEKGSVRNGIIIGSEILLDYIKKNYPGFYFVSSTTKVLTDFEDFRREVGREEFSYVVPDFRLNKAFDKFSDLTEEEKNKMEMLCNECCSPLCKNRKKCYEDVSRKNLGEEGPEHACESPDAAKGYRFSRAIENPCFIGPEEIINKYLPIGINNFKIEGRGLGSAIILEMLLFYMTKPEYRIYVREAIYLDSMLDLF